MRDSLGRFIKGDKRPYISARNRARRGENSFHWKGGKLEHKCPVCEAKFFAWKSDKRTFCSRKCCFASETRSKKISVAKTGVPSANKGRKRPVEVVEKIRKAQIGQRHSPLTEFKSGADHRFWKGGEKQNRRGDPAYHLWRKEVYVRDGWKCRMGDISCGGKIEAHHILNWAEYPELRYNINNGITLCHAHHPRRRAEEKRLTPYFMELVSVSTASL